MNTATIRLRANGVVHECTVPVRKTLLDFLREDLGLTGTHAGCEHGVCGCCNVLLDGRSVRACLMFAVQVDGCAVTTVEGLAAMAPETPSPVLAPLGRPLPEGEATRGTPLPVGEGWGVRASSPAPWESAGVEGLHPVQRAFVEHHALQCGYCTPGMLIAAVELLARVPRPSEEQIRVALAGNLCRCTGYVQIIAAVAAAAREMAGEADGRAAAGDAGGHNGSG